MQVQGAAKQAEAERGEKERCSELCGTLELKDGQLPQSELGEVVLEAAGATALLKGKSSRDASRLRWAKFWLVATGVWWGVCMQLIVYQGAGNPMAMLPNIDWYVGMMLVYSGRLCARRETTERYATIQQRHVMPIAICDYAGTVGTTVGLILAGSALFGIIYSSVTVWTALFTCLLLRKRQSATQLAGIAMVVAGLALPTLEQAQQHSSGESAANDANEPDGGAAGVAGADTEAILVGIVLTAVGTLFYALEYTLCERAFSLYDRPLDPKQLCFYTGAWGLAFTAVWVGVYTAPNFGAIVVDEVDARGGSPALLALLFAAHTVNNGVHNAAWFVVCELESGVSTGLLMGLKAAALFVASALCFCREQSPWPNALEPHDEQCMTQLKVGATAVVLCGTAVYYWPNAARADEDADGTDGADGDGTCAAPRDRARKGAHGAQPLGFRMRLGRLSRPAVSSAEFSQLAARVDALEARDQTLRAAIEAMQRGQGGRESGGECASPPRPLGPAGRPRDIASHDEANGAPLPAESTKVVAKDVAAA